MTLSDTTSQVGSISSRRIRKWRSKMSVVRSILAGLLSIVLGQAGMSCATDADEEDIDAGISGNGGTGGDLHDAGGNVSVDGESDAAGVAAMCTAVATTGPGSPPYAAQLGCYAPLSVPEECSSIFRPELQPCATEGGAGGVFTPEDLPCGGCDTWGQACTLGVRPLCDCDGDGPNPARLDPLYWDQWVCLCEAGTWQCWINAPAGSSCFECRPDGG